MEIPTFDEIGECIEFLHEGNKGTAAKFFKGERTDKVDERLLEIIEEYIQGDIFKDFMADYLDKCGLQMDGDAELITSDEDDGVVACQVTTWDTDGQDGNWDFLVSPPEEIGGLHVFRRDTPHDRESGGAGMQARVCGRCGGTRRAAPR